MSPCLFSGCTNASLPNSDKCSFHRSRKVCQVNYCTNIVYARGKCVRHGGRKKCSYPQCNASAHRGDLCYNHGGPLMKRLCSVEGCTTQAHARRLCVRHGGGRQCAMSNCTRHAKVSGYCSQHRPPAESTVIELPVGTIGHNPVKTHESCELDEWNYIDHLILDSVFNNGECLEKMEPTVLEHHVFI